MAVLNQAGLDALWAKIKDTFAAKSSLAKVATSGSFNDLSDKPALEKGDKGDTGAKALQIRRSFIGTFTTIGQTVTGLSINEFNRTPIVGDVFMTPDGSSNLCTWEVTQSSGTVSIKLLSYVSAKGANGDTGAAGKTPVKGTDYFTASEISTIESNAATAAANSIQVGGRNLAQGSQTIDTTKDFISDSFIATDERYLGCKVVKTSRVWSDGCSVNLKNVIKRNNLVAGDVLTFSTWHRTDDEKSRTYYRFYSPTSLSNSSAAEYLMTTAVLNDWHRFVSTIAITSDMIALANENRNIILRYECSSTLESGKYHYWAATKLERGNKPTDWTPAPEDMATVASPALTGTPTAPTAAAGTNTTQIATTAFVSTAVSNISGSISQIQRLTAAQVEALWSEGLS